MTTLLTHEWLAKAGGSENVFEQLTATFPNADQYCLWNDDIERFPKARETWLSRTPLRRGKAISLPFLRSALRSIPVENYDTVLASSHAFGHYNAYRAAQKGSRGFAYVHSPARYIWAPEHDVRGQSAAVRAVSPLMRRLDRRTTSNRVSYAANSEFVRRRIQDSWGVDSEVIHPPVAVKEIAEALAAPLNEPDAEVARGLPDAFLLGASRLVGYKRLDLVIDLAAELGRPVVIAGDGPERLPLEAAANRQGVRALFLGRVSDRLLFELYRRAALFVFLPVEDFGIMPLEAVTAGCPVLVNSSGGAWEGLRRTGAGLPTALGDLNVIVRAASTAMTLKSAAGPDSTAWFANEMFAKRITDWTN